MNLYSLSIQMLMLLLPALTPAARVYDFADEISNGRPTAGSLVVQKARMLL